MSACRIDEKSSQKMLDSRMRPVWQQQSIQTQFLVRHTLESLLIEKKMHAALRAEPRAMTAIATQTQLRVQRIILKRAARIAMPHFQGSADERKHKPIMAAIECAMMRNIDNVEFEFAPN